MIQLLRAIIFLLYIKQYQTAVETIFQCDRVFDDEKTFNGEFSFPLLPKQPSSSSEISKESNASRPPNLQCVYTFVARPGQRVKMEFEYFQLAGSSESCEIEYVDIYSELEKVEADLLTASLGGRYCGSVAPHIRISLHNVLVLVFHSRSRESGRQFGFRGKYSFIPDTKYQAGTPIGDSNKCNFLIDSSKLKKGAIYSPTYPGTYPGNFHCSYLLKGKQGQRIRLLFRDFDIYFGGEHCPYDSLTVYDGAKKTDPIIKKVCGLQQRMEFYSVGPDVLIHFNSTNPAKADPRGFVIDYEFSSRFVDVAQLLGGERGVTHLRGTECDVRVESQRETTHYIHSPRYPRMYPKNTTCSYILDGLQGDQNLEKVILTFEVLAVLSDPVDVSILTTTSSPLDEVVTCPSAWVGVATTDANMRNVLSTTDESNFDTTLCDRIVPGSPMMGPYESEGPRMVIQFGTTDKIPAEGETPLGFKAKVEFKTDFGVTGESMGSSNECLFRFRHSKGFFNSPRYPANYPLDTNCTYYIEGRPGKQILIHFEQFALYGEADSKGDYLEIYDVFKSEDGKERLQLKERYCCAETFPGPTISSFGSHAMRVVFSSDASGTGNGFKALYEITNAPTEDIPTFESEGRADGRHRCGRRILASEYNPTGNITSPNFPHKYNKDVHCDWEVVARKGYKILLKMVEMEVEGSMRSDSAACQKAVIRVSGAPRQEYCGTNANSFTPLLSLNNSIRISFLTAPDKVNGLKGFNMSWTEVKQVKDQSECSDQNDYLCTYSNLCINSQLRCNGDHNCGIQDDTDELFCERKESRTDRTIVIAGVVCGVIFLCILALFCILFKKKLEKKKKQKRNNNSRQRQRQPYRSHKPMGKAALGDSALLPAATSRILHHDSSGILPPISLHHQSSSTSHQTHTFYG